MVEFCCNIPSLKGLTEAPRITSWNSYQLMNMMRGREGEELQRIIDHMGELSAIAQRLRSPITTVNRLQLCFQKLYLLTSGIEMKPGHILAKGILKVGQKHLFIRKDGVQLVEMSPLCVLDFYVHETCQRQGLGHKLFQFMLEQEDKRASQLGYDRPSNKLLFFMAKHYKLRNYNSQTNQFVVYNDYFKDAEEEAQKEKENRQQEPKMPDIGTMPREEKVLHGRKANPHAADAKEPNNIARLDSSQVASAEARLCSNAKGSHPQPSFQRGRRTNWALKPESERGSDISYSPRPGDTRLVQRSPPKSGLPLSAPFKQEPHKQGKDSQANRHTNSQSSELTKSNEVHEAALKPSNNLRDHEDCTPFYSVIDDVERLKIQSLCLSSLGQKMNLLREDPLGYQDGKHTKPQALSRQATKQITRSGSKEPPSSYPFWTEAKELSTSHGRTRIDYRRSSACS